MRSILVSFHIFLLSLSACLSFAETPGRRVDAGKAFLQQLQQRDSVLVADQLLYGFNLENVKAGTDIFLPEYDEGLSEGVEIVSGWKLDTVKVRKGGRKSPEEMDLKGGIVITSFDEGKYELPPIHVVRRSPDGVSDTLVFSAAELEVKTMPVDTSSFEVHDIKGQIQYPLQFREVFPYVALALLLAALTALAVFLAKKYKKKKSGESGPAEPAHIVALRKLDAFRGDSYWVPEKQKTFYSGVTDALREYIVSRYGIAAMEMTTKEIFDDLADKDIPSGLYGELKELFERADYVKFAKYVASQHENASAVPLAVKFVTMTYQEELESESSDENDGADKNKKED